MKHQKTMWIGIVVLAGIVALPTGLLAEEASGGPRSTLSSGYAESPMGGSSTYGAGRSAGYAGGVLLTPGRAFPGRIDAPGTVLLLSEKMKREDSRMMAEDLNVMAEILDNRLRKEMGEHYGNPPRSPFDSLLRSSGTEAMYVQGYGALFMTAVKFPVVAPPAVKEKQPEERGDPVWERTRRQMYGGPAMEWDAPVGAFDQYFYRAEKVGNLRKALLETLKHAANIRKLSPEEVIMVVVFGAEAVQSGTPFGMMGSEGGMYGGHPQLVAVGGSTSVLTVSVRKSDVDALAEGRVNEKEFADRAGVLAYQIGSNGVIVTPEEETEKSRPAPAGGSAAPAAAGEARGPAPPETDSSPPAAAPGEKKP